MKARDQSRLLNRNHDRMLLWWPGLVIHTANLKCGQIIQIEIGRAAQGKRLKIKEQGKIANSP